MKYLKILLIALTTLIFGCKCQRDPEPDLCRDKKATSADFFTYRAFSAGIGFKDPIEITDSFAMYAKTKFVTVNFKAKDSLAKKYEWYIGDDPRVKNGRETLLGFSDVFGKIKVTLIVTKAPNTKCFPTDDGKDTLAKFITLFYEDPPKILGRYKGANTDAPLDSFIVQFGLFGGSSNEKDTIIDNNWNYNYYIGLRGLNRFSKWEYRTVQTGTKTFFYDEDYGGYPNNYPELCDTTYKYFEELKNVYVLHLENSIKINYNKTRYNYKRVIYSVIELGSQLDNLPKTFIGHKLSH